MSWIPRRKFNKGDILAQMREENQVTDELSTVRAERTLEDNIILCQARDDIFEQVAAYLLLEYGESRLEERVRNFCESWDSQYDKHGDDLIIALAEMTDALPDRPFVNYAGYINKEIAKQAVRDLRMRRKNQ